MKLNFNQGLLILLTLGSVGPYSSYAAAILGAALVGAEAFKYFKETKQAEADLAAFEEAFKKYRDAIDARMDKQKEGFDSKLGTLDSRVSTFVAMRKM